MDSPSLCAEVCKQSGWLGEVLFMLVAGFFAARTRKLAQEKEALKTEKTSLVAQLSLRPPPPAPVQITFPLSPELVAQAQTPLASPDTHADVELEPDHRAEIRTPDRR